MLGKVIFDSATLAQQATTNPGRSSTTIAPDAKGGTVETTTSKGDEGETITRKVHKDKDGRPTKATEKDGEDTTEVEWSYDKEGRILEVVVIKKRDVATAEKHYRDADDLTGETEEYWQIKDKWLPALGSVVELTLKRFGLTLFPKIVTFHAEPPPKETPKESPKKPESVLGDLGRVRPPDPLNPRPSPTPIPAPKLKIGTGYNFNRTSSPGLNSGLITTPFGRVRINLPSELYRGDTFTGTIQIEPLGKTEIERARNQTELNRMQIELGERNSSVAEKTFTRSIPLNVGEAQILTFMHDGKPVVSAAIPIPKQSAPNPPSNTQLPKCGQMGKNVVVTDHFDGIVSPNDSCFIGSVPVQFLAESPRARVMLNTNETPGPTQIRYTEQSKESSAPFQNLGVTITSPNTNLLRNQKTTMEVVALVQGIQQDVSLDVVNDIPGTVSISGGNKQHFTIHPADVQQDGTFRQTFTITASQAGNWGATATVSCVEAGPSAAGPQLAPSPGAVGPPTGMLIPPTPTPSPSGHSPTPTPHASPSPCAAPPPPTMYSVMNLGPLSETDSPASCRATGVNDAGNVIGVCSPSYFGASGGASHAFRTETGKVIDKEKDDLGLPAGVTSGGTFATAINAGGHVVGYWTSGADKAFWHDGSRKGASSKYAKMIDLHPGKPFTTSKAFALNKDDDVVGAAFDPKVGPGSALGITFGGHAVIWPGADPKKMKDLNDDLDAITKKDWILIVAFGISDDGDIVGRALNKKGKYHAFLLKGVGGKFIDLGALKEEKFDSSVAYAINECGEKVPAIDKVVGYTLITTSAHYGFVWTEAGGLMDFGALPDYSSVPYAMESYGQAINKKGEVVGASGPGYYISYFEGLGGGPGLVAGSCTPNSHALWYNGSELKNLNKLIPDAPGWELDLANGISDKGSIAGSGYYKCFVAKGGTADVFSHLSHAVLLTPAGLAPLATASPKAAPAKAASCPISIGSGGYIFNNWNVCGVKNGPTEDSVFTLATPSLITFIATYHWNDGKGALPGSKGISVKDSSGKVFGPWSVTTSPGSGGPNVNWECHPGIVLPAGTYTVLDPAPATWSQNDGSGNSGFTRVAGSTKK